MENIWSNEVLVNSGWEHNGTLEAKESMKQIHRHIDLTPRLPSCLSSLPFLPSRPIRLPSSIYFSAIERVTQERYFHVGQRAGQAASRIYYIRFKSQRLGTDFMAVPKSCNSELGVSFSSGPSGLSNANRSTLGAWLPFCWGSGKCTYLGDRAW